MEKISSIQCGSNVNFPEFTGDRVKTVLKAAPYSKKPGAKGGVNRTVEAVTAPSDNVSEAPAPKKAGKSSKKQGGKVKTATA